MEEVRPSEGTRRCPSCGALASADADWCGQCFTALPKEGAEVSEPTPEVSEPTPEAAIAPAVPASPASRDAPQPPARVPTWPCPTCGNDNPIELDVCSVCGTSFATMMRSGDGPTEVDPKDALVASLIFPGLGQRKLGRPLDGFARGTLFVIMCALALMLAFANGSGVLKALFALYLLLALGVYLGSAYEAYRMAEGAPPIVSTRNLLWATAAIVIVSVFVLALSVITVAKR